jgi:hypothetical protein
MSTTKKHFLNILSKDQDETINMMNKNESWVSQKNNEEGWRYGSSSRVPA